MFWEHDRKIRLGYGAVAEAWEDRGRFCLFFKDRSPLVLPKRGLAGRTPEDFHSFLERVLEMPMERM